MLKSEAGAGAMAVLMVLNRLLVLVLIPAASYSVVNVASLEEEEFE